MSDEPTISTAHTTKPSAASPGAQSRKTGTQTARQPDGKPNPRHTPTCQYLGSRSSWTGARPHNQTHPETVPDPRGGANSSGLS